MRKMMSMNAIAAALAAAAAAVRGKRGRLTARARWRSDINGFHILNSLILLKYTRPAA